MKLAQMPEEMTLFRGAGWLDWLTMGFGVVQLGLGLLLLPRQTTHAAAIGMAVTFAIATTVLCVSGMVTFGVFSLLFIASAAVHARLYPTSPPG